MILKAGLEVRGTEQSQLKQKQQKLTLWSLSVVVLLNFETRNLKLGDSCGFKKFKLAMYHPSFSTVINSHNYRISMFNVTIHVLYNCQMRESLVITAIPTNKTYLSSDLKQGYKIQL